MFPDSGLSILFILSFRELETVVNFNSFIKYVQDSGLGRAVNLFISDITLLLWLIFWHFQNGCHFQFAAKFVTAGSNTGSWICQLHSHDKLRHFEYLIDALVEIWTEIWQFKVLPYWELMTSSTTSWIRIYINLVTILWYIWTTSPSSMMISLFVCWLSWKMFLFHSQRNIGGRFVGHPVFFKFGHNPMIHMDNKSKFNDDIFVRLLVIMKNVLISLAKEHRGPICRPPCDVIDDVITMENTFSGIIWDDLFRSGVKLKLYLKFQHFQNCHHFELATNLFYRKWYQKLNVPAR